MDSKKQKELILNDPLRFKCQCGGSIWLCFNRPKEGRCEPKAIEMKKESIARQLRLF